MLSSTAAQWRGERREAIRLEAMVSRVAVHGEAQQMRPHRQATRLVIHHKGVMASDCSLRCTNDCLEASACRESRSRLWR